MELITAQNKILEQQTIIDGINEELAGIQIRKVSISSLQSE